MIPHLCSSRGIHENVLINTLFSHLGRIRIDPEILLYSNFPPAEPDVSNLKSLCLYGNRRIRFTSESFSPNSKAYVQEAGKVLNRLESWFAHCCYGGFAEDDQAILCCVRQAWGAAMSHYCDQSFSTKTMVNECCEMEESEKYDCFQKQAPNPYYQPLSGYVAPQIPSDMSFIWDTENC
ncbi:hypothetical protein DNTS_029319 [Danionella cerebrum]|uniref:Uncharacterized protein n=1 Tax=Danionella cerebrum TaxID=2873325 RepID=A0A553R2I0_9TELE|nr:hypothetical protein DNTS_029319 [Danionella translucida]